MSIEDFLLQANTYYYIFDKIEGIKKKQENYPLLEYTSMRSWRGNHSLTNWNKVEQDKM